MRSREYCDCAERRNKKKRMDLNIETMQRSVGRTKIQTIKPPNWVLFMLWLLLELLIFTLPMHTSYLLRRASTLEVRDRLLLCILRVCLDIAYFAETENLLLKVVYLKLIGDFGCVNVVFQVMWSTPIWSKVWIMLCSTK